MDHLQYIPNHTENSIYQGNILKVNKSKQENQLRNLKQAKEISLVKRSFGDISNRVGRVVVPKVELLRKHNEKAQIKDLKTTKFTHPFPDPDFRPDIKEEEDYGDVLPEQYKLSNETISRFVKFWKCPQKTNIDVCPPSPTHSLDLYSPLDCHILDSKLELLPVEDDMGPYDLPPLFW